MVGRYPAGIRKVVDVTSTGTGDSGGTTDVRGINSVVTTTGTNSISAAQAIYGNVKLNGTGGTISNGIAGLFLAEQTGSEAVSFLSGEWSRVNTTGSATVNNAYGVQAFLTQSGTGNVTNWRGFFMTAITASSTGDVTGAIYAFEANSWGRATASTAYAFDAEDATKGSGTLAGFRGNVSAANGKYNLYMVGTAQNYLAGSVGIGVTNPGELLDIAASLDDPAIAGPKINFKKGATNKAVIGVGGNYLGGGYTDDLIVRNDAGDIRFGYMGSENFRITSGGNVGIGTISPTQKLSVNGTIQAKEVIVQSGWSDYVFAEGYHLAPLCEVEAHIKHDKHLPGIPSAADVAAGGVSLGDMQSKLLEKIEELTLHQIAQEKRLNEQAERIGSLERENAFLRRN